MAPEVKTAGGSAFARRLGKQVQRLAQAREDVILLGEAGTGRKTIALDIHAERGKKRPVIVLDAPTATDAELRVVLAGADPGVAEAATGRRLSAPGDHATLVVGDVESLAPHNQGLLASFLKDGRKKYTGLKVIVTMQHPLIRLAQSGALVPELLAHLERFEVVEVPPLRERLDDIPTLATQLTRQLCALLGKSVKEIDENTTHILTQGQWPGNMRQLSAVIGRAVMISHGDKLELPAEFLDERQHLTDAVENIHSARVFILDQTLDLIEKLLIQRALRQFMYNQSKTAQVLGLSEANFRYRLKKFGLTSIRQKA